MACKLCGGRLSGQVIGVTEEETRLWETLRVYEAKRGLCRGCHAVCLLHDDIGAGMTDGRIHTFPDGTALTYFKVTRDVVYVGMTSFDGSNGWYHPVRARH